MHILRHKHFGFWTVKLSSFISGNIVGGCIFEPGHIMTWKVHSILIVLIDANKLQMFIGCAYL